MSPSRAAHLAAAAAVLIAAAALTVGTSAQSPNGEVDGLKAKFIDVAGVRTRYYEYGQGEPVLLIHGGSTGGSSTANVWSRNIPGLAKRLHVVAIDRLGSGLTGNPADGEYGAPAQVEFTYRFIQALKLGRTHIVGHSGGGQVGFNLAIEHPDVVKTLVMMASGASSAPRAADDPSRLDVALKKCPDQNTYAGLRCRVEALAWKTDTFDADYWAADAYMAAQPTTKAARAAVAATVGDEARAKQAAAYRQRMLERVRNEGAIQVPVLVYLGKNDVIDWGVKEPVASLRAQFNVFHTLAEKNPRVQLTVLNDSGHFMYREHVEQFNRDLVSFVDFWSQNPSAR